MNSIPALREEYVHAKKNKTTNNKINLSSLENNKIKRNTKKANVKL